MAVPPPAMLSLLRQNRVPPAVEHITKRMTTQPWHVRPWHHDHELTNADCCGNGTNCWHFANKSRSAAPCKGCGLANILHKNWLCPNLSVDCSRHERCSA